MARQKPKTKILVTEDEDPTVEDLKRAYQRRLYSEHAVSNVHTPPSIAGLAAAVRSVQRKRKGRK